MLKINQIAKAIMMGAIFLATTTTASAKTNVLLNCFVPSKHVWCEALKDWGSRVDQVTEGRVRVTIPPKSLAPPPEQLNAVRSGLFDAAIVFNGFIGKEVAGPMVAMNPFTGGDRSQINSIALWRTYEKFFGGMDEYEGAELLGLLVNPGAHMYSMTDKPISSFADALDRKMWALPGATAGMLKQNGGSVVSGPAAQMTEIIQRGVVDGFVGIPPESAVSFNVLPYTKSVTRTPRSVFTAVFSFFISDEKWAEIGTEDQANILSVSHEEFASRSGSIFDERNDKSTVIENDSIEVFQASDEFYAELQEVAKPFEAAWIKRVNAMGVDGLEAVDFYKNEISKLTY